MLLSACGLLTGILEHEDPGEWSDVLSSAVQALSSLVAGECAARHYYYHVPAPWTQVKMLRLLQFFNIGDFDDSTLNKLNDTLSRIVHRPAVQIPPATVGKKRSKADAEKLNRSNAEHAVLMEALNLIIHLGEACSEEISKNACATLGSFVSSKEANIRYLGIETMSRMANLPNMRERFDSYRNVILAQLMEPDTSVRRQALNLLYAICSPQNWQHIVDELLEVLSTIDASMQEELVLKIAILSEKDAPDLSWYVDVVFKMLEYAPAKVGEDVWFRLIQVVTGFDYEKSNDTLQKYAAGKAYDMINTKFPHETLITLAAYLIGEFGHFLSPEISYVSQFTALNKHFGRVSSQCKGVMLISYAKLLNGGGKEVKSMVKEVINSQLDAMDCDVQQRACELSALIDKDPEVLQNVLEMMPAFSEHIQENNPLTRRCDNS